MVGHKSKGDRLRVAVLMGGPSSEHEVSLQGGANVVAALPPEHFHVRPVVISKEGVWRIAPRRWQPPEGEDGAASFDAHASEDWREHVGACEAMVALREWGVDVAVPVLHGRFGEDGTVQAILAAAGIPYVGSDMASSATAFDKVRTKEILRYHGIETPDFEVVAVEDVQHGRRALLEAWIGRFGLPLVMKNPLGGSTLEVRIAHDEGQALAALEELAQGAERIMVEAYVRGRELTSGVVEDREAGGPVALPVVEIRPRNATHFDYQQKYAADGAEELCPAPLPEETEEAARALGLQVHRLLGLRGLSRTDVILSDDGRLQFLEVNTLPGMTERGLVPLAAARHGMDFPSLVSKLVRTARL
jgi:D-alanine-D-alanine ligase